MPPRAAQQQEMDTRITNTYTHLRTIGGGLSSTWMCQYTHRRLVRRSQGAGLTSSLLHHFALRSPLATSPLATPRSPIPAALLSSLRAPRASSPYKNPPAPPALPPHPVLPLPPSGALAHPPSRRPVRLPLRSPPVTSRLFQASHTGSSERLPTGLEPAEPRPGVWQAGRQAGRQAGGM